MKNTIEGIIEIKAAGFGFVVTSGDTGDIFISRDNLGGAFHGDKVRVRILGKRRGES